MPTHPLKKMSLQFVFYGLVIAYLCADLFLFHGPIARRIALSDPTHPENIAEAKSRGVVARAYTHQITRSQMERMARHLMWLKGIDYDSLPAEQKRLVHYTAVNELIDHALLKIKAMAYSSEITVDEKELDARVARFKAGFRDEKELTAAMRSQGFGSEQDLRERFAARIQQERYVEMKIGPLAAVSEEEARTWYGEHANALAQAARTRARHVFLPTLEHPDEDARAQLEAAKQALESGAESFAQLAARISKDPATSACGGELGWFVDSQLPEGLPAQLAALPIAKPTIVQSRIGWHLIEVLERKPAEARSFEQARPEIEVALTALKRQAAIEEYRKALRQKSRLHIEVFHDMLE